MKEYDTSDMVSHPPHCTAGGIECIDAIAALTSQKGPVALAHEKRRRRFENSAVLSEPLD